MSAVQIWMCSALALSAHEGLDAQVLLQIAEEDFDPPAFAIDLRDGGGTEAQVVAQQHQDFLAFLHPQFDAAE